MRVLPVPTLFAVAFLIGGLCSVASCGSDDHELVGTWTFTGTGPAIVTLSLSFKPDKTCTFVEQVAPLTTPAGSQPNGCVATDTYACTYAESAAGSTNTLTWTFVGGTRNAVSGCNTPSNNYGGTPMTAADVAAYTDQGLIPHATVDFAVTSTTLTLTPGIGFRSSTVFTRSP